jgi:undecaprenyl-diphosphatase
MRAVFRGNGLTILWFAGLVFAIAVAAHFVAHPGPAPVEARFARWVQSLPLATLARLGNDLAYGWVSGAVGVTAALIALARKRWDVAILITGALLIRSTNTIVKQLVERPRPTEAEVQITEHASGYSFPSGHTFGSALLLGALILTLWRLPVSRRSQFAGTIVLLLLVIDCGMARVYVGAHWPTDVGGAWLIAALCLVVLGRIAYFIWLRIGPMDHFRPVNGGSIRK